MIKRFKKMIDPFAIVIGIVALIYNILFPDKDLFLMNVCHQETVGFILCAVAGIIGILYLAYAAYLLINRPKFDRHLHDGNFLWKVITFVVLLPSVLTFILHVVCPDFLPEHLYSDVTTTNQDPSLFWTVFFHMTDPGNQNAASSLGGRGLSALIAILGIFLLNGLLVSSIVGWVDSRKEKWQNGDLRYGVGQLGKYRYAVVIGANEIAASVIHNLFTERKEGEINYRCEGNNRYVIIQTSRDAQKIRDELAVHLSEAEIERVIIYTALRDSESELRHLHLEYATEIYVLGESTNAGEEEASHDALNMRCANIIARILNETRIEREVRRTKDMPSAKKVCKVMFEYQTTYSIFQFSDVPDLIKDNLIFIPFNRYDSWARKVMADNSVSGGIRYIPLDGPGIMEEDDTHVHLVIVGMSNMGVAMGIQAMLQAHYLNFAKAESLEDSMQRETLKDARRTRITFIDKKADKEMAFFMGRFQNVFNLTRHRFIDISKCEDKHLEADSDYGWVDPMNDSSRKHLSEDGQNFIDIELDFIKGELESEGVRKYISSISDNNNDWARTSRLTVALCMTHTHQSVAASLYMPICIYEKAQQIWVYQRESEDIIMNLSNTSQADKRYKKLLPFGMLYGEYMTDRRLYLKSILVNGAYNLNGEEFKKEERDMSRKETYADLRAMWKGLTLDKKYSNKYFADIIPQKLRSLGNPSKEELRDALKAHAEVLARCEHNRWNMQQLLFGYSPCNKSQDDEFKALNEGCSTKEGKKAFKDRKLHYKEGEDRIHPNICSYDHLDAVDSGAKAYDEYLNNSIPDILELVDEKCPEISL